MTVVNPKSISGINSITMASGSDDLLTIHSNNTTERVRVNNSGDVIVGSGVTLSPDGDIFATGITTVSGNVKVGTGITLSPDGDVFFTGIATGNGSGLTNLATDLVNDTSPQLGGDLQSNSHDIKIADASGTDGNNIYMGSDNDMRIHHDGSNFEMSNSTGTIYLRTDSAIHIQKQNGTTKIAEFNADADCELYHNGTKQCETSASGLAFPSGKGIDFSATANGGSGTPSEILDDYEEGTWTPTVIAIASPNYTVQVGRYTKIGNLVNAQAYLLMASGGGEGSNFGIGSLPFTSLNTNYSAGGGYIIYENGFFSATAGSAGATCTVWVPENNTVIQFHARNSGNNIQGNGTAFGLGANNRYLIVQVQYTVA